MADGTAMSPPRLPPTATAKTTTAAATTTTTTMTTTTKTWSVKDHPPSSPPVVVPLHLYVFARASIRNPDGSSTTPALAQQQMETLCSLLNRLQLWPELPFRAVAPPRVFHVRIKQHNDLSLPYLRWLRQEPSLAAFQDTNSIELAFLPEMFPPEALRPVSANSSLRITDVNGDRDLRSLDDLEMEDGDAETATTTKTAVDGSTPAPPTTQWVSVTVHPAAQPIQQSPGSSPSPSQSPSASASASKAISIPPHVPYAVPIRLAVFDLDSTLIQQEVIDELARGVGLEREVAEITERAMRGELGFAASLVQRVRLLRGLDARVWEQLKPRLTFTPGARELTAALRKLGVRTAVISGGFIQIVEWIRQTLGMDFAIANHVVTAVPCHHYPFSHLTGELKPTAPMVTPSYKRLMTLQMAAKLQLPLSQVMCVGDGANDLEMLGAVGAAGGIAVGYNAKPKVQAEAQNRLSGGSMLDLLYLLGLNHHQVARTLSA